MELWFFGVSFFLFFSSLLPCIVFYFVVSIQHDDQTNAIYSSLVVGQNVDFFFFFFFFFFFNF